MPSDRMFNRLLARQDRELQARHRTERDAFLRAQMASRERHEVRLGEVTSATAEDVALARAMRESAEAAEAQQAALRAIDPTVLEFAVADLIEQHCVETNFSVWAPDDEGDEAEHERCTICLESVDDPKTLMLQCGHRFHRPCLSKWLHTTLRMQGLDAGVVCPTCKQGGGACCAR